MESFRQQSVAQDGVAQYDQGLRGFMLQIYNYMASALALTGLVAWFGAQTPAIHSLFYKVNELGQYSGMTGLGWVITFAPLAFALFLGFRIQRMSFQAAQMAFWGFAFVMGLSLMNLFFIYTGASIARVFFITSIMFGSVSLYGYVTKRDLTGMGTFLMMGVWGLFVGFIVNMFLKSTAFDFALSAIGVLVFTGLIAYDTQKLKQMYYLEGGSTNLGNVAIMGALNLYLDFINLFIMLLRFFGERR